VEEQFLAKFSKSSRPRCRELLNTLPNEQPAHVSGFADECPGNPGARIFKGTADDSPSPWGEGRVEGAKSLLPYSTPT
jgi:hypothetical protein